MLLAMQASFASEVWALKAYCTLEVWVDLLNDMHPKTAAPLNTALLQEEDQPASPSHYPQNILTIFTMR